MVSASHVPRLVGTFRIPGAHHLQLGMRSAPLVAVSLSSTRKMHADRRKMQMLVSGRDSAARAAALTVSHASRADHAVPAADEPPASLVPAPAQSAPLASSRVLPPRPRTAGPYRPGSAAKSTYF